MAHPGEEEEKFKCLSLDFMSEESDPDDDGSWQYTSQKWRFKQLRFPFRQHNVINNYS